MKKDPRYKKILIIDVLFLIALTIGFIYLLDKFNYSLIIFTIFTIVLMGVISIIIRKVSSNTIDRISKKNNKKDKK